MQKKYESGRTMVELIGVIAIMGLLGIIGFAGYNFSLDYLRAKNMSDAFLQAKALMTTRKIRTNMQLAEYFQQTDVKKYLKDIDNDNDEIHIIVTLDTVSTSICNKLFESLGDEAVKITNAHGSVSSAKDCTTNKGLKVWLTNEILFARKRTELAGVELGSSKPKPEEDENVETDYCPNGEFLGSDNNCYSCANTGDLPISASECATCPGREMAGGACVESGCGIGVDKDKPLTGTDNVCYSCDDIGFLPVTIDVCAMCPNREMRAEGCAFICQPDYFLSDTGVCYKCDMSSDVRADSTDCINCANREMMGNSCVLSKCGKGQYADKPLTDENGACYGCEAGLVVDSTKTKCVECNTSADCKAGTCYNNTCNVCQQPTPFWNADTKSCDACPDEKPYWNKLGYCVDCPNTDTEPYWNAENNACEPCPDATPFWNGDMCVTCATNNPKTPVWNGSACESCVTSTPDTPYWDGNACVSCATGLPATPFWNGNTCVTCVSNNASTPFWTGQECANCYAHDNNKPYWDGTTCVNCEVNNKATPFWDGKICTTCVNNNYNTPYWNGNACTSCAQKSASTPFWNGSACTACPANSSTAVVSGGKIGQSVCYCKTGYKVSGNACVPNCPVNSSTYGSGNYTSNGLCRCNSNTPWWSGGYCRSCSSGYVWNGSVCVSPQGKCNAAGWSYSNGYCFGPWRTYSESSEYNPWAPGGGYSCGGCPSGFVFHDCPNSIILDTYLEYRTVCRWAGG